MTVTEDLALLLHDPVSGKGLVDSTSLPRALAGAAVLDLVLTGRAEVRAEGRKALLEVVDPSPSDPVLDAAIARLDKPRTPKRAIEKLAGVVRDAAMTELVRRGVLRDDRRRYLGFLPDHRWPAVDRSLGDRLRDRMRAVLVDEVAPDEHEAALVSLLRAVRAEHKVVEGRRADLRRRSKQIAEGEWAGEAVRKAIADVQAAVMAAVVAGSAASSS